MAAPVLRVLHSYQVELSVTVEGRIVQIRKQHYLGLSLVLVKAIRHPPLYVL